MKYSMIMIELILLVLLVVLVFVISWSLKKKRNNIFGKQGKLEELERFYYSPRSYISIVKVGVELILLGVTDSNISLIKKVEDEDFGSELLFEKRENEQKMSFGDLFNFNSEKIDGLKGKLKKMRQNNNEED